MGWNIYIYIEGYFSWLTCGQTASLSLVSLSLKCLKSHEAHASPNVHATCGTFIDRETSKRVKKESFMMAIPSCDDCRFPKRSPSRILWRFFSKSSGSTFPLGDACRFLVDFAPVTTNKSTRWSIVLLYGPCTMVETEGIGRLHIWASGPVALTQDCLQRSRRVSPPMIQHSNSIWKIGGSIYIWWMFHHPVCLQTYCTQISPFAVLVFWPDCVHDPRMSKSDNAPQKMHDMHWYACLSIKIPEHNLVTVVWSSDQYISSNMKRTAETS